MPNAPNMDTLDWQNSAEVECARKFFDICVTSWNPRDTYHRSNVIYRSPLDDPCLMNTAKIFAIDISHDYKELVNRVQRHTKCTKRTCLRKKGNKLTCKCKVP